MQNKMPPTRKMLRPLRPPRPPAAPQPRSPVAAQEPVIVPVYVYVPDPVRSKRKAATAFAMTAILAVAFSPEFPAATAPCCADP
jgi:hypothetical protein